MAYLILVRHGQSKWNALGLWQGITDVPLTIEGVKEAKRAAEALQDIEFHVGHTSQLKRAKKTLKEITKALKFSHIPVNEHKALNERHYGVYTGKNKWQVKETIGEEEFLKLRRHWDYPIEGGESLKQVHARVVPYFEKHILADLKQGKNVIVTSHGNTIRALIKHLEDIAEDEVHKLEIGTGEIHMYEINEEGKIISKQIRATNPKTGKI